MFILGYYYNNTNRIYCLLSRNVRCCCCWYLMNFISTFNLIMPSKQTYKNGCGLCLYTTCYVYKHSIPYCTSSFCTFDERIQPFNVIWSSSPCTTFFVIHNPAHDLILWILWIGCRVPCNYHIFCCIIQRVGLPIIIKNNLNTLILSK